MPKQFFNLIGDSPTLKPLQILPLLIGTFHTKADCSEKPEHSDDTSVEKSVEAPLRILAPLPGREINTEAGSKDRKVQCRVVMVHIGDTTHSNEREVVEYPTNNWVDTSVVDLINFVQAEIGVSTLPTDQVE